MCSDPQDHSQELSEDQNVEGGLCSSLEESKGGNWDPACTLGITWPESSPSTSPTFTPSKHGPGSLGTRSLRYASKTVWMLSDNKVASNPVNGSQFELLHEDGIWHTNA
jgi:hypothetical protein